MKWDHIITEVFWFYLKFLFVYSAYWLPKIFIAQNRPSLNPPFTKRIGGYLRCIASVVFIAGLASNSNGEGDDAHNGFIDKNRGVTVFIVLLLPVLLGATEGFATEEKFPNSSSSSYDDM